MTNQGVRPEWYRPADGAEERERLAARWLDTTVPNVARIYDYLLGGKDNFQVDRDAAAEIARQIPHSAQACQQNRDFLGRVVRYLAVEQGVCQFLDIGSGLPTKDNVHEIAQSVDPRARIVYVDYDPVVVTHARALLEKGSPGVLVVQGDFREPERIVGEARAMINFSQPVAVLLFAVLHFLTDADQPGEVVRGLTDALVPGSALAVSHVTGDGVSSSTSVAAQQVYRSASAPVVPRSHGETLKFFAELKMSPPGLVDIQRWRPTVQPPPRGMPVSFYGGVGRKQRM